MRQGMERNSVQNDSENDDPKGRIDRLQNEVERIARLLDDLVGNATPALQPHFPLRTRLDQHPGPFRTQQDYMPHDYAPQPRSFEPEQRTIDRQRAKAVRRMLRQRRMREQYFPADLFADPAWDMLLDLYAARLERQPVSVSSLCIAASVPATTALRWIKTMTDAGLFVRDADPHDGRRIFIGIADKAAGAMENYFQALDE